AEGGSPPPPAAKAGMDGGDAIRATENSASVASLIADFIMRTSGFSYMRIHGPAAGTDPARREVFPPARAEALRVAAGWTNDGNAYLIDGRRSSPQKWRTGPGQGRKKPGERNGHRKTDRATRPQSTFGSSPCLPLPLCIPSSSPR